MQHYLFALIIVLVNNYPYILPVETCKNQNITETDINLALRPEVVVLDRILENVYFKFPPETIQFFP